MGEEEEEEEEEVVFRTRLWSLLVKIEGDPREDDAFARE